jgi:hypothetical protein
MSFGPVVVQPREEREVYPYRRVWRTASIEILILVILALAAYFGATRFGLRLEAAERRAFGLAFAVLPFGLWLLVSYRAERRSPNRRDGLLTVTILSALAANAISVPLVERAFAVDEYLTTAYGLSRILGYTFTAGIVQEFLKYAVVRYSFWPVGFRIRSDGIAYAMAAGIGHAVMLNLNFALSADIMPEVVALRIAEVTLSQVALSTIMGYFLSELKIGQPTAYELPAGLLLAAFLNGLSVALRSSLVVSGVAPGATASEPLRGLGMAIFLVVALFSSLSFLINNADERAEMRSRTEFRR